MSSGWYAVFDDSFTVFDTPTREERARGAARIPLSTVGVFLGALDSPSVSAAG